MHALTRRLAAVTAGLALIAGAITVVAAPATAAGSLQPARDVVGFGINYGYELAWAPPADTTGLTGYSATIYLESDPSTPIQPAQTVAPSNDEFDLYADFTGLTVGTRYVGKVVARYGAVSSESVTGDVDQAYQPIGRVGSLKLVAGKRTITASWKAPTVTGATGPLQGYLVEIAGSATRVAPGQKSIRFTRLTNGRRYTVVVTAGTNDLGASAAATATPITTPAKPTKLKRTWKKGGKAKLSWKSKSTAAAPVAGYYVYVNGKRKATLGRGTTSYTAKGLKKGKKYSFSVKARNAVGTSASAKVASKKRP